MLIAGLGDYVQRRQAEVGVRITHRGRSMTIGAGRGVMLAGGGFDANRELRQKYHGIDGDPSGAPGNLGGPIEAAVEAGAATELMDDAWWGASVAPTSASEPGFLVGDVIVGAPADLGLIRLEPGGVHRSTHCLIGVRRGDDVDRLVIRMHQHIISAGINGDFGDPLFIGTGRKTEYAEFLEHEGD